MLMAVLAGALLASIIAELWLLRLLRRAGAFARPIQVDALDAVTPTHAKPSAYLRETLKNAPHLQGEPEPEPDLARCLAVMQWLVEQFPAMGAAASAGGGAAEPKHVDPRLFPHPRRPHCGEIAALYREALAVVGVESRALVLRKNLFDPRDSHVSVEARIDGQWALIDPTFNATFTDRAGQPLGAQELKARLYKGQRDRIVPAVHGRALCPLTLDTYYFDVFACFNNVFVADAPARAPHAKLPLLCYAQGPRWHYEKLPDESAVHLDTWRRLYTAAALVVPAAALLFCFAMAAALALGLAS